jgi:hypothetical protein
MLDWNALKRGRNARKDPSLGGQCKSRALLGEMNCCVVRHFDVIEDTLGFDITNASTTHRSWGTPSTALLGMARGSPTSDKASDRSFAERVVWTLLMRRKIIDHCSTVPSSCTLAYRTERPADVSQFEGFASSLNNLERILV